MSDAYSYHTFILPFVWETGGSVRTMEDMTRIFEENPFWENIDLKQEHRMDSTAKIKSDDDAYTFYKEYQYFHPYARKAIYGYAGDIVHNYSFCPEKIRNQAHYRITRGSAAYDLLVNAIELKIYCTGIALFILECENHGENGQNCLAAVKNINDYGRRIALPFLPRKEAGYYSICADKLEFIAENLGIEYRDDFRGFAEKVNDRQDIESTVHLTHTSTFIKKLLTFGSTESVTSEPKNQENSGKDTHYIYPALDDRMFVACWVSDKEMGSRLCDDYKKTPENSSSLYEFAFVDPDGNCSCQDSQMRKELLEKHVYRRWIDYGTVYTMAAQGLMGIGNGIEYSYLIESFLTQYIQMCCLCLMQRASLIHFQREASVISERIGEHGKKIRIATISRLMDLQESFIAFQSQLSFTEVTPQEQGIEMYEMLMDSMFVAKEEEALKAVLDSLYEAANTNLDFSFNKWGGIFALAAIILEIAPFVESLWTPEKCKITPDWRQIAVAGLAFCAGLCMAVYHRRRR